MLQQASPAVSHCHARAAESEHLAKLAQDPFLKKQYLGLADTWRKLAENREFVERMDRFLTHAKE
jgi:hypothetical protein